VGAGLCWGEAVGAWLGQLSRLASCSSRSAGRGTPEVGWTWGELQGDLLSQMEQRLDVT